MAKFTPKQIMVEAEQYHPGEFFKDLGDDDRIWYSPDGWEATVETSDDGDIELDDGDWVTVREDGDIVVYTDAEFSYWFEPAEVSV